MDSNNNVSDKDFLLDIEPTLKDIFLENPYKKNKMIIDSLPIFNVAFKSKENNDLTLSKIKEEFFKIKSIYNKEHGKNLFYYILCGAIDEILSSKITNPLTPWEKEVVIGFISDKSIKNINLFNEIEKIMLGFNESQQILEFLLFCFKLGYKGEFENLEQTLIINNRIENHLKKLKSFKIKNNFQASESFIIIYSLYQFLGSLFYFICYMLLILIIIVVFLLIIAAGIFLTYYLTKR